MRRPAEWPGMPFARPLYALIKPVGARCNLSCRYCYYHPPTGRRPVLMSDDLLALFTRQYIEAQTQREVLFTWHGGEPTLLPLTFYERALALQRRWAGWHVCDNALQTNGTLLSDDWCRFLAANRFLVGISLDGPQPVHDAWRGQGSWERVMRGIDLLERHGVEWNVMAVVHEGNVQDAHAFYRFFREIGCTFLQFTPLFRTPHQAGLSPEAWGTFLCTLFDEWYAQDVGKVFVQLFEATLANWCGVPPGVCTLSPACGDALVVEADGNVYSCDHFVQRACLLGNLRQQPLTAMAYGNKQQTFRQKKTLLPTECLGCAWQFACHGECPANRREGGASYLCQGYRKFFAHVAPAMEQLAEQFG